MAEHDKDKKDDEAAAARRAAAEARQEAMNAENARVEQASERGATAPAADPMATVAMLEVMDLPDLPHGYDGTGGPTKTKKFIDSKTGGIKPGVEVQHESGRGGAKWEGRSFGPLSENRKQRILQLMNIAKEAYPGNQVMQRISIAQAINESGWGVDSGLAKQNNLFGIKGKGTSGSVNMGTFEEVQGKNVHIKAGFAANETVGDSFAQHRQLMRRDRYARVRNAGDFNSAAHGLVSAGYATDSAYAEKLMRIDQRLAPYWAQLDNYQPDNGMNNVAKAPNSTNRNALKVESSAQSPSAASRDPSKPDGKKPEQAADAGAKGPKSGHTGPKIASVGKDFWHTPTTA